SAPRRTRTRRPTRPVPRPTRREAAVVPSPELRVEIDLRSGVAPYEQIRSQVVAHVAAGRLRVGDRLPTIPPLATDLGLAPGTAARAYRELEASGVATARRRAGTVVADGVSPADVAARHAAHEVVRAGREAGLADEAILDVVRAALLDAPPDDPGRRRAAPREDPDRRRAAHPTPPAARRRASRPPARRGRETRIRRRPCVTTGSRSADDRGTAPSRGPARRMMDLRGTYRGTRRGRTWSTERRPARRGPGSRRRDRRAGEGATLESSRAPSCPRSSQRSRSPGARPGCPTSSPGGRRPRPPTRPRRRTRSRRPPDRAPSRPPSPSPLPPSPRRPSPRRPPRRAPRPPRPTPPPSPRPPPPR